LRSAEIIKAGSPDYLLRDSGGYKVDATSNWNNHAAAHFFRFCTLMTYNNTFRQAYLGTRFEADFEAMLSTIAGELQTVMPSYTENDLMGVSLSNWPG
jgi:hypothetical protein